MHPRNPEADRLEADYYARVRAALRTRDASEVEEVIESLREHINEELPDNLAGPISLVQMANVLEKLGSPETYASDEAGGQAAADSPRSGPQRRTLSKLALASALCLPVAILVGVGVGLLTHLISGDHRVSESTIWMGVLSGTAVLAIGLTFGIAAFREMKNDPKAWSGRGLAWIGVLQLPAVWAILFLQLFAKNGGSPPDNLPVQAAPGDKASRAPQTPESVPDRQGMNPEMQGGEILLRARRAYDALTSYTGTIRLEHTANYAARPPFKETRKLDVSFQSPDKLRLDGPDSNRNNYTIQCDGQTTTVSTAYPELDGPRATSRDALSEFQGISLGATTMLPSILLGTKWEHEYIFLPDGDFLSAFSTNANLEGTEAIGGVKCYRIVCPREIATWTLFVDVDSFLIRRVDQDVSEEQMLAQKQAGGGGYSGLILSTHTSQRWEDQPAR